MLDKYRHLIEGLSPMQALAVARPLGADHTRLWDSLQELGMTMGDVVAGALESRDPVAINAVEAALQQSMMGPIPTPPGKTEEVVGTVRIAIAADDRVMYDVQPNPKRLGTGAWHRYNFYREGLSVQEFYRLGGRHSDIRHDSRHGHIKLRSPDK